MQLCPKPVLKLTLSSPSMGAELSYPPHIFTCFDVTAEVRYPALLAPLSWSSTPQPRCAPCPPQVDFSFHFARVALALRTLSQQGSNVHPSSLS